MMKSHVLVLHVLNVFFSCSTVSDWFPHVLFVGLEHFEMCYPVSGFFQKMFYISLSCGLQTTPGLASWKFLAHGSRLQIHINQNFRWHNSTSLEGDLHNASSLKKTRCINGVGKSLLLLHLFHPNVIAPWDSHRLSHFWVPPLPFLGHLQEKKISTVLFGVNFIRSTSNVSPIWAVQNARFHM